MLRPRRASAFVRESRPTLDEWRAVVVLLFLLLVWLTSRVVLLNQLQQAAGEGVADARLRLERVAPVLSRPPASPASGTPGQCVHTVLTSNGNSYMNWQTRVMYATWQAAAAAEPGSRERRVMTAFTRVLHRSTDDELMQEVPTQRFTPAHLNCDVYCSFPVADRAPALLEWSRTADAQRCSHLLLVETDYVFVKPLSAALLPAEGRAVGFPYSYIQPEYPSVAPFARRFYPPSLGPLTDIPPTGNAPVLLARPDFDRLVPAWAQLVAEIEADEGAVETLGWVRDMYAWSFAAARTRVKHDLQPPPINPLMVQPPADTQLGEAAILHYTWGPVIHNASNAVVWEFDKRSYCGGQYAPGPRRLVKIPEPPQWEKGLHLQPFFAVGNAVTPSGLELMRLFVHTFNAAVEALPELPAGFTDKAAAEAAALPSRAAQELADFVQREIAAKEEAKKKKQSSG